MAQYTLLDGVQAHNNAPLTFEIPSNEEKASIKLGDYVKLCFEPVDDEAGEKMWVKVIKIDGDHFIGKLDNDPLIFSGILSLGMEIEFDKPNIIGIIDFEEN